MAGLARSASPSASVRLRIDLGYDGTAFAGWARQPGLRTVQGELEAALATVLRLESPPQLTVAGRTDAGVHARGQVAHVDVPPVIMHGVGTEGGRATNSVHDHDERGELDAVVRRLNGVLGHDVRVKQVSVAPLGFEARFSALSRRYAYRVADGWRDPLRRHDTLGHTNRLDLDAMNEAAALLLGQHDFAAFCRRREGATTIRTLLALVWTRDDADVAVARVEADAFCHSMVRAMIGALLTVGDGRRSPDWPASALASRTRERGAPVAPARGLTLEEVRYPPNCDLRARAEQSRQRRDEQEID